jgi:hypothetical protein
MFGKEMSDHMLEVDWNSTQGWTDPRIIPYGPFVLEPSCSVFHYATEVRNHIGKFIWKIDQLSVLMDLKHILMQIIK